MKIMKKLFAFSIKTVWELIKYIKPLYELIAAIVNIIKNDKTETKTKTKTKRFANKSKIENQ